MHIPYRHPGRLAGGLIIGYFAAKAMLTMQLAVLGQVVPGYSGRLMSGASPEPGQPVIYFYTVNAVTYNGWRRGIDYGAQEISVVHAPLWRRFHVTVVEPGLASPWRLWLELDFWLRLVLAGLGMGLGGFVVFAWERFEKREWRLLHGLDRHDHRP